MKKTLFVMSVVLVLTLAANAASKGSWTGWITDEKCGAAGANAAKAECSKKCVESGQKAVFVNDKDGSILQVSNQDAVTPHAGHHVKVTGTVDSDSKTLTVDKVTMMAAKSDKKKSM